MTTLRLANGMANPSVCPSVVCDVRASYSWGLTFRGYFCTIRQLTHQKSRRSSKGITPSERVKQEGGEQTGELSHLAISSPDEFLVLSRQKHSWSKYIVWFVEWTLEILLTDKPSNQQNLVQTYLIWQIDCNKSLRSTISPSRRLLVEAVLLQIVRHG